MDNEGFQLVRRKRRLNHRHSVPVVCHGTNSTVNHDQTIVDMDFIITKIHLLKDEIKCSELYNCVSATLCVSLKRFCEENGQETSLLTTLICYGLGNFSSCVIARYQLAFFLCLKDDMNVAEVSLFDPVFSIDEKTILIRLNCNVIAKNEEGKRKIDSPTLFYMPHCAKELYNNLLWANWSPSLSKLVILGNSFSHMMDSQPFRQFCQNWSYISKAAFLVEEYSVKNCFKYNDIFNDTAVHIFPKTKITCLQEEFWSSREEPVYQDSGFFCLENVEVP